MSGFAVNRSVWRVFIGGKVIIRIGMPMPFTIPVTIMAMGGTTPGIITMAAVTATVTTIEPPSRWQRQQTPKSNFKRGDTVPLKPQLNKRGQLCPRDSGRLFGTHSPGCLRSGKIFAETPGVERSHDTLPIHSVHEGKAVAKS